MSLPPLVPLSVHPLEPPLVPLSVRPLVSPLIDSSSIALEPPLVHVGSGVGDVGNKPINPSVNRRSI